MEPVEPGCKISKMDNDNVNSAILERVERVVEALQDNSIKMGELLAVHNEKLDKQDRIDAVLFEKIESLHKDMDRARLMIVFVLWKRRCGALLVLSL